MNNKSPELSALSSSESSPTSTAWDQLGAKVPYVEEAATNLPNKSPNRTCNFYLKEIERQGRMGNVQTFLDSALGHEYHDFSSEPGLAQFCETYSDQISAALSYEDKTALKTYSGYNYKYINQVARGHWNYDLLGAQTPENLASAKQSINQLSHAISAAPAPKTDLIAHRGTNLDSFQGYQVHSISDLANLQNQFFVESGFTSTSLDHDQSFADRQDFDDPLRRSCNVSIEYLIPADAEEVVGLLSEETSYSPNQRELLIDKGSLSYISSVEINPDQTSAKLQMVLIPRQIYDPPKQ